jgi:hypothetical protein
MLSGRAIVSGLSPVISGSFAGRRDVAFHATSRSATEEISVIWIEGMM